MNTIEKLAARAFQISAEGHFHSNAETVPSPCISVCRMTPERSRCEGCWRTLDEIRAWSTADGAQRRAIWARLLVRAGIDLPKELT
jgi:predicted Fe-S protein YdhL (DUF1289 family)